MRTTKRSALTSGAVTVLAGLLTTGGLCTIGATPALAATPPAVTRVAATPVAASTPRAIVQEIGNNQEVDAGHAFPQGLAVRAIDVYGNGVAGVPVTFTIEPTTASQLGTASFPNTAQSVTVTSDADGYAHTDPATTPLMAQGVGDLTILATTPGLTTSVAFPETVTTPMPLVTYLSGSGQTGYTRQSFPAPVLARIADEYGNPLSNVPVTFTLLTTQYQTGSAIFPNGTNTTVVDSSGSGQVTSPTINAGATPGTVTLETCAGPRSCAISDLTITDAPPASMSVTSGDGQTAAVNTGFADPLTVKVLDAGLNPAQGQVHVRFSITGAPAQFAGGTSSTTVAVAPDGTATAPQLIAGPLAGAVTVRASVVGSNVAPVSFTESIG